MMDVGSVLRQARLARRLSLAEVADLTNVRPAVIASLENNDFSACGGEVFVRGHVRTIATALGIDPSPLLEALGGGERPARAPAEHAALDALELRARAHVPSEARIWALLAVLAALIVGVLLWNSRANDAPAVEDPGALPTVTSTDVATVTPEATPTGEPTESGTSTPSSAAGEGTTSPTPRPVQTDPVVAAIVLELNCIDATDVNISNAGGVVFAGPLRAGDAKVFTSDTDVRVTLTNAAGVMLAVNGIDQGSLGAPGEAYAQTFRIG